MAFEADCGVSTVLEEFRVASTAGFLVPGDCRTAGYLRPAHFWGVEWRFLAG